MANKIYATAKVLGRSHNHVDLQVIKTSSCDFDNWGVVIPEYMAKDIEVGDEVQIITEVRAVETTIYPAIKSSTDKPVFWDKANNKKVGAA